MIVLMIKEIKLLNVLFFQKDTLDINQNMFCTSAILNYHI